MNSLRSWVDAFADLDVLVVGDAMLDAYLLGTSERLAQEAPVPVASVRERELRPGGAANVAANVAALGGRPSLVAVVGDDREAHDLRTALRDAGVDPAAMVTQAGRRTLSKARVVVGGQVLVRVDEGTTDAAGPEAGAALAAAVRAAWHGCDAVVVSDYGYGALTDEVVGTLGRLQASDPRVVVVDAKDLRRHRSLGPTAVKPNHGQALGLLGRPGRDDGARDREIADLGPDLLDATGARIVAVTLDADGAIAFERGHAPYRTYAKPRRAASTSGAGDTFAATLALALAAGVPTPPAVELASAASAIVVGKDRTARCNADELRHRVGGGDKVVDGLDELAARVDVDRRQGRRIVFTNGCFDLLHRGHVTYLSRAKELGDVLVVAVNSDESVRALKGPERPITPLEDRIQVLAALSCVDLVVAFDEVVPHRAIEAARPDVVVKGGDYTVEMLPESDLVERLGGVVRILPYVDDRSTSGIIERIRAADAAEVR
jgi:D-beta-D-heptose 7-phosphate kinase / D-beta-D-heptose 1-phosphate adenosyltransferase